MTTLPDDIQFCIVPYLNHEGLGNYRLASQSLSRIGAKVLFRAIKFHASCRSVRTVEEASKDEHIRKCVKEVVWDTNMWDLVVDTFDEWSVYVTTWYDKSLPRANFKPEHIPEDIDFHKRILEYKVYRQRREEEIEVLIECLQADNLASILSSLPALNKVRIMNKALLFHNGRVLRVGSRSLEPQFPHFLARGEMVFGNYFARDLLASHALRTVTNAFHTIGSTPKLWINPLDYRLFSLITSFENSASAYQNLTSLKLGLLVTRKRRIAMNLGTETESRQRACYQARNPFTGLQKLRLLSVELSHGFGV
ncbi:hypothetical protein K504DRAFT_447911 [Pleomassaria siparia CBS 279.74]|uniref:F-box domain-containing protein n=1 Tax=Pleomassaria siparia CBS 279.74 TaxID=1314801 RepID=A0A6G1K059_9PLEO|nr:hypothetical protein K504DRAFT_447911 [Pleomassaria siparia CBS 279.74]